MDLNPTLLEMWFISRIMFATIFVFYQEAIILSDQII